MLEKQFNWDRGWTKKDSSKASAGEAAFLESFFRTGSFTSSQPFAEIAHIPCLILLGAPGMGKTRAIKSQYESLKASQLTQNHDYALYFDLGAYDSGSLFIERVFHHNTYNLWKNGSYRLHLFLDGLDEGLLKATTIASLIADEMRFAPLDRLFLRIACRVSDWPAYLEGELKDLWPQNRDQSEPVQVYELASLSPQDIALSATEMGLASGAFLAEIERVGAMPLAERPISLRFLLDEYLHSKQLPNNRIDVYHEGCLRLCLEPNERRRKSDMTRNFETEARKRLDVATQMAGAMVFGGRYAIYTVLDQTQALSTDLSLGEILSANVGLDQTLISETLSTALFNDDGAGRHTWAHRSFAEYLAGCYITHTDTSSQRVIRYITSQEGDFIPQLYETIGWLAEMNNDIFREITRRDPLILLRTDLSTAAPNDFTEFIDNLLQQENDYFFLYLRDAIRKGGLKLKHPQLRERLFPYIENRNSGLFLRQFILVLIDTYQVSGFDEALLRIILDKSENEVIRRLAIHIIYDTGSPQTKSRLKPLIYNGDDDTYDELKGYALLCLWPDQLGAGELFQVLTPPKRMNFVGGYMLFLSPDRIVEHLQAKDLPVALKWIEQQPEMHEQKYELQGVVDAIMRKAWHNVENPDVFRAFTSAVVSRIALHDVIFGTEHYRSQTQDTLKEFIKQFVNATGVRRRLVEAMISIVVEHGVDPMKLAFSQTPLLVQDDLMWLIEQLNATANQSLQNAWATLIDRTFNREDPRHIEAVYETSTKNAVLAQKVERYFTLMRLDDPQIQIIRKDHIERKLRWQKIEQKKSDETPPEILVENTLQSIEGGVVGHWITLSLNYLMIDPTGGIFGYQFDPDLTTFPGWSAAGDTTQFRILNAAKQYLTAFQPTTENWIKTGSIPWADIAGYLALFALLKLEPLFLQTLDKDVWNRWVQVIVWHPIETTEEDKILQRQLITIIYQEIPDQVIQFIDILLDADNEKRKNVSELRKFEHIWDERLSKFLVSKVQDPALTPDSMGILLNHLLSHDVVDARSFAAALIQKGCTNETEKQQIVWSAITLATHSAAAWPMIWETIQKDTELGREIVGRLADSEYRSAHLARLLSDHDLADFFIWIEQQYPHSDDPNIDGFHTVSTREEVGRWRDSLLRELQSRGTFDSRLEIERIASLFPDYAWLQVMRVEAKLAYDRHEWSPSSPGEILNLNRKKKMLLESWTRSDKLALSGITLAIIALIIAVATCVLQAYIPEVRYLLGAEIPPAATSMPADEGINTSLPRPTAETTGELEQLVPSDTIVLTEVPEFTETPITNRIEITPVTAK